MIRLKIIYHCFGGSHSSVTAAAIHVGILPVDRIPTREQLEQVPYFDRQVNKDHGHLRLMGIDEYDNEIYIIGRRNTHKEFESIIMNLAELFEFADDIHLVNCMPYVNWKMVVDGYTSRRLKLVSIGRPIIVKGVQYSYLKIASLVQNVKVQIAAANKKNITRNL